MAPDGDVPWLVCSLHRTPLPHGCVASGDGPLSQAPARIPFLPGCERQSRWVRERRGERPEVQGQRWWQWQVLEGCGQPGRQWEAASSAGLGGHLAGLPGSMGGECGGSPQPAPGSGQLKHRRGGVRLQSQGAPCPTQPPAPLWWPPWPTHKPSHQEQPLLQSLPPLGGLLPEAERLSPGPC